MSDSTDRFAAKREKPNWLKILFWNRREDGMAVKKYNVLVVRNEFMCASMRASFCVRRGSPY